MTPNKKKLDFFWRIQDFVFNLRMFLLTSSYYVKLNVMVEREEIGKITCEENVYNFESLACLCGLTFPETATQFQKATLTLAHMMASVRESILRGSEVPFEVINWVNDLTKIIVTYGGEQR